MNRVSEQFSLDSIVSGIQSHAHASIESTQSTEYVALSFGLVIISREVEPTHQMNAIDVLDVVVDVVGFMGTEMFTRHDIST